MVPADDHHDSAWTGAEMRTLTRKAEASRSTRSGPSNKADTALATLATHDPHTPAVPAEARDRLAECCAFFMAEKHRKAAPDEIRKRDIETARLEIEAIIKNCGED
jgi:hypothetical protein